MEKMIFNVSSKNIKIKEALQKDFLELEMYSISNAEPNRNNSCFTYESMKNALPTFYNKPILGFFNPLYDNFEEHNFDGKFDKEFTDFYESYVGKDAERALGLIRESDKIEIIELEDGLKWIHFTCAIWCKYNREQVKRILKDKRKKVSVEVSVRKSHNKNNIKYIDEFVFDGVTILGNQRGKNTPAMEGIENAHLQLLKYKDTDKYTSDVEILNFIYNGGHDIDINYSLNTEHFNLTKLYNDFIVGNNIENIIDKVFFKIEDNWEKDIFAKLRYPVMYSNADGVFSYNKEAIEYSLKQSNFNKDIEAETKLRQLQRKLGLLDKYSYSNTKKKGCVKMFENISEGYSLVNETEDFAIFTKDKNFYSHYINKEEETTQFSEDSLMKINMGFVPKDGETEVEVSETLYTIYEDLESVKGDCEEKDKEIEGLKEEKETLTAEKDEISKEIETKNEEISEKDKEIEGLKEEKDAKETECDTLTKELNSLKEKTETERCENIKCKAVELAEKCELSKEEAETIFKNCIDGKYADETEMQKDIAFAVFVKDSDPSKFSAKIKHEHSSNAETLEEKLKRV